MAYATRAEMGVLRPGGIDGPDEARAEALLEEASVLIDDEVGLTKAAEWAEPAAVIPRSVKSVCIQVALRVFDNPSDISMEQATGYMYQRPQSRVTGLELTKSEKARVRAAAGKSTAYSVRMPSGISEDSYPETVFATDDQEG